MKFGGLMNLKALFNSILLTGSTAEVPAWVASSFPVIEIVLAVLITICSIFMIVAVVMQKGESNGATGITGASADTFYNRNKGGSLQGKLKKLVMIDAIVILVLAVLFLICFSIYTVV